MKKKTPPAEAPVISKEILEEAKRVAMSDSDHVPRAVKCVVCGTACAANAPEGLCWVCRRLKISAWRDSDVQAGMQE